jgi:hypothetical protein
LFFQSLHAAKWVLVLKPPAQIFPSNEERKSLKAVGRARTAQKSAAFASQNGNHLKSKTRSAIQAEATKMIAAEPNCQSLHQGDNSEKISGSAKSEAAYCWANY